MEETLRLQQDRPVPCVLRADLMLRTPGLKSPTPIVMASCPYVSVKPLAELKLGWRCLPCLEDAVENKVLSRNAALGRAEILESASYPGNHVTPWKDPPKCQQR